jgi:hypothetical protein
MDCTRTWGARSALTAAMAAALSACGGGGQTGDLSNTGNNDGGGVIPPGMCEPTGETIGLDDPLPAGYSARELLDRIADTTVPAFAWRSEDALFDATYNQGIDQLKPEHAEARLELRVRVRYEGDESIELYDPECEWGDAIALPVTLSVEASDGSVERDVPGIVYSTPEAALFYADDDGVPPQRRGRDRFRECDEGPVEVSFSRRMPRGRLCDARGRVLVFPAACGGFAQVPTEEHATPELPAPDAVLAEVGESARYDVMWPDGERSTLEITVTPSEYVCHHEEVSVHEGAVDAHAWWETPLALRFEWIDEGLDYALPATLNANDPRYTSEVLLFSNEVVSDEVLAFFRERLDVSDLTFGSQFFKLQSDEGSLEASFRFYGEREVSTEDSELDVVLGIERITP